MNFEARWAPGLVSKCWCGPLRARKTSAFVPYGEAMNQPRRNNRGLLRSFRLSNDRGTIEIVAGRDELLRKRIAWRLGAFQRSKFDVSLVRVLPVRLDELAESSARGLVLKRLFKEAIHDVHAVFQRRGIIQIGRLGRRELLPKQANGCGPVCHRENEALCHRAAVARDLFRVG